MRMKVLILSFGVLFAAAAATPEIKIISPANGTIVAPGGVLVITVEATPFAFRDIFIAGTPIGLSEPISTPPYRFAIRIPPDTPIGSDTLEAHGVIEQGEVVDSPSLTIDVERPDTPQRLKAMFSTLRFDHVGEDTVLNVSGVFADGSTHGVTRSRYTSYQSASPAVVSVEADGRVTAKGIGSTVITIQHRDKSATVRVTVKDNEIPKQD